MTDQKVMNRWLVVVGALLIQLCLGAIYAWSVFTPYLKGATPDPVTQFNFTSTQTQAIFSVGLASFAVIMILAGRWQAKSGPRLVSFVGGVVLGLGYIIGSFVGKYFIGQLIAIGLIGGAGIGLAYVCPIAVGMRWFPDKKGLITGLAVAGFGFGAMIWVKLAGSWGHLIESHGVLRVFLIYGIVFAAAVIIGSFFMKYPPETWKPKGYSPPEATGAGPAAGTVEFESGEMLRTPQFYGLWTTFIFSAWAGLMTIGIIKLFGIDALQKSGYSLAEASAIAGTAMAVYLSIANGLGRIIWGTISEKIGRKRAIFAMTLFQGIMMLLFYYMGGSKGLLFLGAAIIGFNFGGNFSLFPTATADFFGTRSVGPNYGWMFTAYGVGGIIGPILAGYVRDTWKNFQVAFIIAGAVCILAAVITMALKPPKKASA
ncbi:MAG: OFA family MFS transporter [bacterium]|nr:MAG: OFA family MFS transporter [bacterium]